MVGKNYFNQKMIVRSAHRRQWVQPHKEPLTYEQIMDIYRTLNKVIATALLEGKTVNLGDLGTLKLIERPERVVRGGINKREVVIPARKRIKFTRSRNFEKLIREIEEEREEGLNQDPTE